MLLRNDATSIDEVQGTVFSYYKKHGNRHVSNFLRSENSECDVVYAHFLVKRNHVIRIGLFIDRGMFLSSLELAMGPHYFGPSDFWSYEASERFKMEASTEAVIHNLALLDEYFGDPDALKHAYGYKP